MANAQQPTKANVSVSASFAAVARCTVTRSQGRSWTHAARTSGGTAAGTGRRNTVAFTEALSFCPSEPTTVSVTRYAPARGKACSTRGPSAGGVPSPKSQSTRVPLGRSCSDPNTTGTPEATVRSSPGAGATCRAQAAHTSSAAQASRVGMALPSTTGPEAQAADLRGRSGSQE